MPSSRAEKGKPWKSCACRAPTRTSTSRTRWTTHRPRASACTSTTRASRRCLARWRTPSTGPRASIARRRPRARRRSAPRSPR
nr:MAG TPA: hypothetical protein [Bacteriophage sp.]